MPESEEQMSLQLETVHFPALIYKESIQRLGRIFCELKSCESVECTQGRPLKSRRTNLAWEHERSRDETYLITTSTKDRKLEGYTGVLLKKGEALHWIRHQELDSIEGNVNKELSTDIADSWANQFSYKQECQERNENGLRPPQIGALHAVAAHWSLSNEAATVVMPTGTGKTETMLSVLVSSQPRCLLVVVPSKALKNQTAEKLFTLGILPTFGIVPRNIRKPIVGVLDHRIKKSEDLSMFDRCNVVVAVVNSIADGSSIQFLPEIVNRCSHLVLDEAHHVAANTWNRLKEAFIAKERAVLQFTATPFREDRSALGGKIVYNYPLSRAQAEGYFLPINFEGVFEIDQASADQRIADKAVGQLRADLELGLDHRLLARCQKIDRARRVLEYYESIAPDLNPVLVHSQLGTVDRQIEDLKSGKSKIVVTVNMLSEGFDLPSLKVAAIHDAFKSLAVTLQFAGRFPRVGGGNYGTPTIVANTGSEDVSRALQGLYDEEANWDKLLSTLHFEKVAERLQFEEFNRNCQDMYDGEVSEESIASKLNAKNLVFRFNTVVYRNAHAFNPFGLRNGLEKNHRLVRSWQVEEERAAFFVTRLVEKPRFTNNKLVEDSTFNLYVMYHDEVRRLLHIGSSVSSANCNETLAKAVSGEEVIRIREEQPYRVFCKVESLMLQQVGLLSGGGARNHRYSMFAGADVRDAIARIHDGASKSNFFGNGFKDGGPVGIGCSTRGKIWGRDIGSLNEWIEWCDGVANDLLDASADTSVLIENVLVREPIKVLPNDREPWFLEWPEKMHRLNERTLRISVNDEAEPFYRWELGLKLFDPANNRFSFMVEHCDGQFPASSFRLVLTEDVGAGFKVELEDGPELCLCVGSREQHLAEFFCEYPPLLNFIDHSSIEGANFVDSKQTLPNFPVSQCDAREWGNTDQRTESRWRGGVMREDSVQAQAMRWCVNEGFDVVIDDDGANEVADIVAVKEEDNGLRVRLLHCKYSSSEDSGGRINDVVEVSSQAVKNVPWMWDIVSLKTRLLKRDRDRSMNGPSRFFHGDATMLKKIARISEIRARYTKEVIVVQPGLSVAALNPRISSVLGSADAYIRMRLGCGLQVWCSP